MASADVELRARHPRGRTDRPHVGLFAQREKSRRNRLGVSRTLVGVKGLDLGVRALEAVDGTAILDVKPYTRESESRGA